jgi:cell division protein FtsA
MGKNRRHITGLDIGTHKICAIIGELNPDGSLEIIGLGHCPSKGMRKGIVVNLDATVEAIKKALEEAELMSGVGVDRVFVSAGGTHLRGLNSRGVIAVSNRENTICRESIQRAVDAAKAISFPQDRELLHVLPQEFIVDDQEGIRNPEGMCGSRLEVNVHIISGSKTSIHNIVTCANRAGMLVSGIVAEQLAASESILTDDEKELGVALVDIGGGTTAIAIFEHGSVWHTSVIAVGGEYFTNDIAVGMMTPIPEAERIKKKYGCALTSLVDDSEMVEIPRVGGRKPRLVPRHILAEIIQPRAEELFGLVKQEIAEAGFEKSLNSGIVLTGGGSSLHGICECAEAIFNLPIRTGSPEGVGGLSDVVSSPIFATAVGLVKQGVQRQSARGAARQSTGSLFARMGSSVRSWLQEIF